MQRRRQSARGSLLLVYSTLASFLIVGGATAAVAFHEHRFSQRGLHQAQAFYLAEAGIDYAMVELRDDSEFTGTSYVSVASAANAEQAAGGYEVTVEDLGNDQRQITAVGYYPSNNAQAEWYVAQTIEVTVGMEGLFNEAAFAEEEIAIKGTADVDSYDSSLGAYAALVDGKENIGDNGDIGSNATVDLTGSAGVRGSISCGKGLDPNEAIQLGEKTTVTGKLYAQADTRVLEPVEVPDGATDLGNLDLQKSSVSYSGGVYVCDDLKISGKGELAFTGATTVYVRGDLEISGKGTATANDDPTNLIFKVVEDGDVKLTGGSEFYGGIYAPLSSIKLSGNGTLYGAVVGEDVEITGNWELHYDESLKDIGQQDVRTQLWKRS